ncbi:MAG: creatininase family protein [Actinobacteria bacterium]|nr:MAG: creatininase family protein [Actinomycetota bacterium]
MTRSPLLWAELRRDEVAAARDAGAVVVIPVGAIEQHGPHLPLNTDISDAWAVATRLSASCDDPPVLVAPPVPWGVSHYHHVFPGTLSLTVESLSALLLDLCRSVATNGFTRIVLLNGHGGNAATIETVATRANVEGIDVFPITYWHLVPETMAELAAHDGGHIGHAGEMETSLQLHLQPDLVDRAALEQPLGRPMEEVALVPGIYWPPRVREEAPDGVYGLAHEGTAEKGERLLAAVVERLTELLRGRLA